MHCHGTVTPNRPRCTKHSYRYTLVQQDAISGHLGDKSCWHRIRFAGLPPRFFNSDWPVMFLTKDCPVK